MKLPHRFLLLTLIVSLSGCATIRDHCQERTALCAAVGAAIVAGVALAERHHDDESTGNSAPVLGAPSDARLKRDVRYVKTLDNGVRLYTFRYWNDDRVFSGVMAQDLLADQRFRGAVHVSPEGYYLVDLEALDLRITGDAAQYQEAGRRAVVEAAHAIDGSTFGLN
jgi:uncharacterized protein YceK